MIGWDNRAASWETGGATAPNRWSLVPPDWTDQFWAQHAIWGILWLRREREREDEDSDQIICHINVDGEKNVFLYLGEKAKKNSAEAPNLLKENLYHCESFHNYFENPVKIFLNANFTFAKPFEWKIRSHIFPRFIPVQNWRKFSRSLKGTTGVTTVAPDLIGLKVIWLDRPCWV